MPLLASRALTRSIVFALAIASTAAVGQQPERIKRFSVWDIHIGDRAAAIPNEYVNFACGTNGGPPSIPLPDFTAFMKCRPDRDGLHEVYFEYDDELEFEGRALENRAEIRMYAGTTVFEFPIVASVLFDDTGIVRGERMVTDPRQQVSRSRKEFWELSNFLKPNFGDGAWDCQDLPADDGESPAGDMFLKNHCEKTVSGRRLILEQRLLQKRGQVFIDPQTGKPQPQAFDSATRFEIYDAGLTLR